MIKTYLKEVEVAGIKQWLTFVNLDELQVWDQNPKKVDPKNFERLVWQLEKFKQYKPLIVTPEGVILGGNTRYRAFVERLGMTECAISIVNPKNLAEMVEISLSDNDEIGQYDKQLMIPFKSLDINWGKFNANFSEVGDLTDFADNTKTEEDEGADDPDLETVTSKRGEVYALGHHRLMCGDSTSIEDVDKLMDGQKANLIFTDPPYNVDYDYTSKFDHVHGTKTDPNDQSRKPIFSDKLSKEDFKQFVSKVCANLYVSSLDNASFYIWFADKWMPLLREVLEEIGWQYSQNIIWVKDNFVLAQSQDYHRMFEPCVHGWKKGKEHYFNRFLTKAVDVLNLEDTQMLTVTEEGDLWLVNRDSISDREHPTQKPIKLAERAIHKSSHAGDRVLDLFGGSGSTLIACEQTDRLNYSMELDPRFCDIIRRRFARLMGDGKKWRELTPAV